MGESIKGRRSANGFRPDINGLRACAVLFVVFYHFGFLHLKGGFIGVDVFFVISGFLMTKIIVTGIKNETFSLRYFYLSRARRIVPALLVLVALLLFFGYFFLPQGNYKELSSEATNALLFFSNVYYWGKNGYFDTDSQEKWLLHTWSLSVEWQFYLLFPVVLVLLYRFWRKGISAFGYKFDSGLVVIILLFVCSFFSCVILSRSAPVASFYLLPTRVWEMLAGGIVFYLDDRFCCAGRYSRFVSFLGWGSLATCAFLFRENFLWPGYLAALPVVATMLIIYARHDACFISNRVVQWIGARSYSVYLYHWPLVVVAYFLGVDGHVLWTMFFVVLSFVLASISYSFVENPCRLYLARGGIFRERYTLVPGVCMVILFSVIIHAKVSVLPQNRLLSFVRESAAALGEIDNRDPRREECFEAATGAGSPGCVYGGESVGAILMGDSHAGAVARSFGGAAKAHGKGVLFWGMSGCPTIKGFKRNGVSQCLDFNNWAFANIDKISRDIPLVIVNRSSLYLLGEVGSSGVAQPLGFISRSPQSADEKWFQQEYQTKIVETACMLAKTREVYLVRPVPAMGVHVPKTLAQQILRGEELRVVLPLEKYYSRNSLVLEAQDRAVQECGVHILNPLPAFCDAENCYGSKDGRSLYSDADHLSEYGSQFLQPMFEQIFQNESEGTCSLQEDIVPM
ncbi:acyltransferase family protein [Desulfotalea psychrophila]|uniref:acyltransferase family protein n=1 Tax=Desulfotalea psychrophila TaxID=84980 RepID=UPI0002E42014|nr:acyltransferase family protein [Desulfotalea psychrophila]